MAIMVNTETMDNTTPSPLLESLVTPKAFDTPVGEEQSKCVLTVFEAKTLVCFIYFIFSNHFGCFWGFLSKKYLRQISILCTNKQEIGKNESTINTFKIDITIVP